ncbi:restriction endonuclease subunit S [Marinobacterium ramblicola]|uniref:restriction endonuclease subunit S n=1 Tax=Marinobacterium ramblicola TaxID=2849041 RepID=UPI001C2DB856
MNATYLVEQVLGCPEGYKQTEVGVIPEDWEALAIRSVCRLINGRGFKPHEWKSTGLPIIRIQNLNGSDEFNYFQGTYDRKLEVPNGQLLFAWSGSRGTSFGPHVWTGSLGLLNYHTWKIEVLGATVSPEFFFYALKQLTKFIEDNAHGASALVHTQKWEMEGFKFPLPPTHAEQEAIAKALSDTDALIESLEQLIAKKRQIKQGTMQELLTGKRRLPGYSGEWCGGVLGNFLLSKPDYGINAPGVPQTGSLPVYLRITDIDDHGRLLPDDRVAVDHPLSEEYLLGEGEIVFARTGASVGKSYLYNPVDGALVFAGFLIRVRVNRMMLCPAFLAAYTKTDRYWDWVRIMSMRSGQPGINGNEYASMDLFLPPTLAEQEAIATVLTDMDTEITTLETKLAKTRQLKQGMMQELLTGRIRLI